MISLVVGQGSSAFWTGNGRASSTFTTIGAGVMPYAGCILCRFGSGSGLVVLQLHRRGGLRAVGGVIGLVVSQLSATFRARAGSSASTFTSVGAGVVPNSFCILGRFGSGWGGGCLRGGGHGVVSRSCNAFGGGITDILVVAAGEENS